MVIAAKAGVGLSRENLFEEFRLNGFGVLAGNLKLAELAANRIRNQSPQANEEESLYEHVVLVWRPSYRVFRRFEKWFRIVTRSRLVALIRMLTFANHEC
jgi:hypothetical protein